MAMVVSCGHCQREGISCVEGGEAHHCLTAQGWYRSPSGRRNWSCPTCLPAGYWAPPQPHLLAVECNHHDELRDRRAAWEAVRQAAQQAAPPQLPAQAPGDVINDILVEMENMGARLTQLTMMFREELRRTQRGALVMDDQA